MYKYMAFNFLSYILNKTNLRLLLDVKLFA